MRSDLSAFCAPAQVGVGDLIKASDTPDGPRPGYHTFSRPPQAESALDGTGDDRCNTAPNHTVDQLKEGGGNAAFSGWLSLSPLPRTVPSASGPSVST